MEEALGADGHGFLEQHDALIGLVAEELQGGEAAGRRHVEMLPAARGHDKAFCCGHVGVLPCGGMRINVGTVNINLPGIPTTLDGSDRTRCQVKLKDSYRTEYGTAMNRSSGPSNSVASARVRYSCEPGRSESGGCGRALSVVEPLRRRAVQEAAASWRRTERRSPPASPSDRSEP